MFTLIATVIVACVSGFWLGQQIVGLFMKNRVDPRGKAVLVTGCDTGFGNVLAHRLHALGFTVFAGCLDSKGKGAVKLVEDAKRVELEGGSRGRMKVLQMDICKDEEVTEGVRTVSSLLPKDKGLWAIVNNAGLSTFGEVEWCSLETFQRVADVNVWGGIRVIKAFLPLIRRAKGRIVQMTSGLARQASQGRSCYVLTKYAMEGLAQCLRYEMRRWGVHVSIIEPGNFIAATGIFTPEKIRQIAEKMWGEMSEVTRQEYGKEMFDSQVETMSYFSGIGTTDPTPVVKAMVSAVTDTRPKIRYQPKDWYWRVRTFVMTILPQEIGDYFYHS